MALPETVAVVPAAGAGRRSGSSAKLWRSLRGAPVLAHTLRRLSCAVSVAGIVVVVRRADVPRAHRLVRRYHLRKIQRIIVGGATRMASVRRGLAAVDPSAGFVLIHDAARPLIAPRLVDRAVHAARRWDAAIVAMPATDTIKMQRNGRIGRLTTPPRNTLWVAQTPQVFRRTLICAAYDAAARARVTVTDDAAAVERLGRRIAIVPSDATNLKITWPADFMVADTLLHGTR